MTTVKGLLRVFIFAGALALGWCAKGVSQRGDSSAGVVAAAGLAANDTATRQARAK